MTPPMIPQVLPDKPPLFELFCTGADTAVDDAETEVDWLPSDPVMIEVTVTTDCDTAEQKKE